MTVLVHRCLHLGLAGCLPVLERATGGVQARQYAWATTTTTPVGAQLGAVHCKTATAAHRGSHFLFYYSVPSTDGFSRVI